MTVSDSVIENNYSTTASEFLIMVVQELSLARDMETVTRIVRTAARKLTGADGATFILKDNNQCYYADEDAISPLWKGHRFPLETCISGWVMLNKQHASILDIYTDNRIPHEAYRPTFVKSLAMVPIRTLDPIGAIGNYWATPHTPTAAEIKILRSLADITAVTIENVMLYGELEKRVADRTRELEDANLSLSAYSHSISHDLRAPLRVIRGFVEILNESIADKADESQVKLSERIVNSVGRMEKMIQGLLDFSSLGQKQLIKSPVSMLDMVQEIIHDLKSQNPDRDIEFHCSNLPNIKADPTLIHQVWTNLLSNAVKYSGKKEKAVVEIGFEEQADFIVYCVKDNGAGFDMQYTQKLFGMFERMHSQRDFEGLGIGLSLAQRIIARHDGNIWANAKEDQGATFFFSLPR